MLEESSYFSRLLLLSKNILVEKVTQDLLLYGKGLIIILRLRLFLRLVLLEFIYSL